MRIGVLTTSYPRAPADLAGRFVAELDAWLAGRGCAVEVLAPAPALAEGAGVVVRPLDYARRPRLFAGGGAPDQLLGGALSSRAAAWAQVPTFVAKLAASCHRRSATWEALISHWLLPCGVVAARAGRGLPHLAIAHATDVHLIERLPSTLSRTALGLLCRPRTQLVLTREGLREPLCRLAPRRARRIVEAALVQRMGVAVHATPPTREHRSGEKGRVLFLGRLVEVKGIQHLLEALVGLNVELVIAGEGPERRRLEDQARALDLHARFVGVVGGEAKRELFAWADLFVLPSISLPDGRSDGAPVTLLEAMEAGLCVVVSEVGDVPEIVTDDESALLVPPGDVGALRAAIERALGDSLSRGRLGAEARAIALRYGWQRVGERLLSALGRL